MNILAINNLKINYNIEKDKVNMEKLVDSKNHITKGLLNVSNCYLLDCENEMFLWLGNKCPMKTRQKIAKYIA